MPLLALQATAFCAVAAPWTRTTMTTAAAAATTTTTTKTTTAAAAAGLYAARQHRNVLCSLVKRT